MKIQELVLNYRAFLLASGPEIEVVLSNLDWNESPYFVDDWLQANWELLVEAQLGEDVVLPPYGFNQSPEARYVKVGTIATHRVMCTIQEERDKRNFSFLCFSTTNEKNEARQAPPYDHVFVEGRTAHDRLLLPIDDVVFSLKEH